MNELSKASEKLIEQCERRARPWQRAAAIVERISNANLPAAEARKAAGILLAMAKIAAADDRDVKSSESVVEMLLNCETDSKRNG